MTKKTKGIKKTVTSSHKRENDSIGKRSQSQYQQLMLDGPSLCLKVNKQK